MHMQRDNEGIRLPKLLGLAVAGATLLAGMVVLPATQASAATDYGYNAEDDFRPGAVQSDVHPQLTVTKYLSLAQGYSPTGSSKDAVELSKNADLVPAKGIAFNVREVIPQPGQNLSDISASDENTYKVTANYIGITDGQGVINTWYPADTATNAPAVDISDSSKAVSFPGGANHWYVLVENRDESPAFKANNPNKLDSNKYQDAAPSFFGLPYAANSLDATDTASQVQGYIYHLHLYPKNMNITQFSKTVQSVKDSQNNVKPQRTAVAGDTISYKLTQKLYNTGVKTPKDGKLDVSELNGDGKDLRIVDRMSSSLKLKGEFKVVLHADGVDDVQLAEGATADYTESQPTSNPNSFGDNKMFANEAPSSNVSYYQFDFFNTLTKVKNFTPKAFLLVITYDATVTGDGDSTGTDGVANDAASDFTENVDADGNHQDPIREHTNVINAVIAFGAVQNEKTKFAALPDTEFRLIKSEAQPDEYLASDGNFYAEGKVPDGVQLYKATANKNGLVAFAALPVFGSAAPTKDAGKTVQAGDWLLKETKTPKDWRNPGIPFHTVTFGDAGKTEEQVAQEYGPHATIQPDYTKLGFGKFGRTPKQITDGGGTAIQFNNVPVQTYLAHYATSDADAPLALPLTGGRGILLLLVVGALIMGGALYARNRRNNAARA
ncbi:LPXTG cell wall anchor domain-containing protein [Bifidobacterium choladohabitans]|uniref:LPXTG cell wall anchor domain-containing protein n=1 Tax=Bifidobacterium choladohabitans TaxID=2750947 RepID=UPI0018DB5280|nr:LPXTG cell wall anchor domain-containing protein [Bifidobacterium choladohabitans]MBI0048640.1 LPXTG cell wall anchor domain-containing protein [Bifidobacterium choladohabitans]